ncbi:GGDEF domain-containing protein [Paraglaciecola agarilytica]|uniref:GGDEF domain-containing protein n=1 Tax=Paraglaciecola chathamensis TaxID=368405 RepID=UPI001C08D1AD|nr:GGDEF domain-containing protein [Paraglaciecola agarilytica]MBU3016691.1 GGDEF domain-containing protein [Paraglaciecola agarilytica]
MEQLNQLYEQHVGENVFNPSHYAPVLNQHELSAFFQKWLTTIDLTVLSELFFQQLQNTLPLCGLKIQCNHHDIHYGELAKSRHHKHLAVRQDEKQIAMIHYAFSRTLAVREWQIVQQLHMLFKNPLKNGLEYERIKLAATRDNLTALRNRSSFNDTMHRLFSHAKRQPSQFALLVIDLDKFKQVNDQYGHSHGDKILIACADTISVCLRDTDFAFRYGGDEFCCLLTDTCINSCAQISQRIQLAFKQNNFLAQHEIGCSIGSAIYQQGDTEHSLFKRADAAMYRNKK